MIISINGYAGSGKDLVGQIVQYLTTAHGISQTRTFEEAQGKTDAMGYGYADFTGYNSPWQIKRWADKLKIVAALLSGVERHQFEDQAFKNEVLPKEWNRWTLEITDIVTGDIHYGEQYPDEEAALEGVIAYLRIDQDKLESKKFVARAVHKPMTYRELLQLIGTEGIRRGLHPDAWVNALMSTYHESENWVITDTRMPNEAEAIRSRGGLMIRINRPGVKPVNGHSSETSLDNYTFDYVIDNNGTTDDLVEKVRIILIQEHIIKETQTA